MYSRYRHIAPERVDENVFPGVLVEFIAAPCDLFGDLAQVRPKQVVLIARASVRALKRDRDSWSGLLDPPQDCLPIIVRDLNPIRHGSPQNGISSESCSDNGALLFAC